MCSNIHADRFRSNIHAHIDCVVIYARARARARELGEKVKERERVCPRHRLFYFLFIDLVKVDENAEIL